MHTYDRSTQHARDNNGNMELFGQNQMDYILKTNFNCYCAFLSVNP